MQVLYTASTLFLKSLSMATDCTSVIKETDQKEIKGQWFAFFFQAISFTLSLQLCYSTCLAVQVTF